MFFVQGWVPLADVTYEARTLHQRQIARIMIEEMAGLRPLDADYPDYRMTVWEICEAADRIGVLLTNGQVVEASRRLLHWNGKPGTANAYVDVTIGTVGSGFYEDADDQAQTEKELGPFIGLPILLPESCMEFATGRKPMPSDEVINPNTPADNPDTHAIAAKISEAFRAGERLTRREYQDTFAPTLSIRKFQPVWASVIQSHPELSYPGRRPKNQTIPTA